MKIEFHEFGRWVLFEGICHIWGDGTAIDVEINDAVFFTVFPAADLEDRLGKLLPVSPVETY